MLIFYRAGQSYGKRNVFIKFLNIFLKMVLTFCNHRYTMNPSKGNGVFKGIYLKAFFVLYSRYNYSLKAMTS